MRIIVGETAEIAAAVASLSVLEKITARAHGVLGVATGSSPVPLYRALASEIADKDIDLSRISAFALDEYVGIDLAHPESYHSVIDRDVVRPLRLDPSRVHVPHGNAQDLDEASLQYELAIADAGGIDVQIIGIGRNGHIGFNEPGASPESTTRVVDLSEDTLAANARFFNHIEDVPTQAMTQGIGTILRARSIVLMASGDEKAGAVAAAFEGRVDSACPASFLQQHPDVTFYLDRAAASALSGQTTAALVL
jgi:glucosamine-6-phosphate deaminase